MNAPVATPIYLDYLSTTPVDPRVAEAMSRCLSMEGTFGNPASDPMSSAGKLRKP